MSLDIRWSWHCKPKPFGLIMFGFYVLIIESRKPLNIAMLRGLHWKTPGQTKHCCCESFTTCSAGGPGCGMLTMEWPSRTVSQLFMQWRGNSMPIAKVNCYGDTTWSHKNLSSQDILTLSVDCSSSGSSSQNGLSPTDWKRWWDVTIPTIMLKQAWESWKKSYLEGLKHTT